MVKYNCINCNFTTNDKSKYRRHLNRRFKCGINQNENKRLGVKPKNAEKNLDETLPEVRHEVSQNLSKISQRLAKNFLQKSEKNEFLCRFCKKKFMHLSSRSKHEKHRCKKRELHVNNNKINNNIVKLNPFQNPDTSHLTDNDYLTAIKKGNMGIPFIIHQLYFNKKKKSNFSVYISNSKNNYINLYNGNKWVKALCDETIHMLIQDNINMIEDKIEEWYNTDHPFTKLHKETLEKFPRFLDKLSISKYIGHKVYEEAKLEMINNNDIIIENRLLGSKKTDKLLD